VAQQQALLAEGDWVAEGRDIALVVAPDAAVKIFLTASEPERARRRAAQTGAPVEDVLAEQRERDERDATGHRSVAEPAPGAVPGRHDGLSLDEVVEQIVTLATEAREIEADPPRAVVRLGGMADTVGPKGQGVLPKAIRVPAGDVVYLRDAT
jgi:cytidylate kinase